MYTCYQDKTGVIPHQRAFLSRCPARIHAMYKAHDQVKRESHDLKYISECIKYDWEIQKRHLEVFDKFG
jgi:hypothetical protein